MPREGIGRFAGKNEFSDVEFLEIFKELLPYVQSGEINLDKVKSVDMVEKMDSSFVHFGLNQAGKFFMESSNSGEVTAEDYQQRFSHTFMADYKAAFASLLENKLLQTTLQKVFKKVGAIRYDAELFPVLTHTGDESGYITFVATKYDKAKFGTKGAFVVFKSWIKDENAQWTRPEPKKNIALISAIESADSSDWRVYTNEKHAKLSGTVELKALNVDKMLSTPEAIDDAMEVLKARGNTTIKAHLKNVITDLKDKLQGVLDKYAEETSSIFSKPDSPSSIEGVVLRIKKANGDIFEIKGTSNAFDTLKKQTWATRSSLSELEAVTEGSFLKDALGLKTAQAAALNRAIKEFGATFTSKEKNPEKREHEFLLKLFDAMQNKDAMVAPEETKKRVQQIFEVAKNQLAVIIDEFKSQKIDPDSKRKSMESLKTIIDKFDTIEKTVNTDMPDEAFQLYIFKFMLDRRLKQYAGQHMNAAEQDYSKFYEGATPVIIWNGRAQPWHRGHDAMVQLAKKKLEELGAEKILILIVKGGKTSMNKEENPLTEKDQKALIEAVYSGDGDVVVSDTPLLNGSLFAIIQKLGEMKAYMVGWLAGDDRIEDYKKLLKSFNASVWLKDHASLPIKVNAKGVAEVEMILTPRVMSGTTARESAKTSDFKSWLANVAPPHSQKNKAAVGIYKQIYDLLNSMKAESVVRNMIWAKFNESVVLNEKSLADMQKVVMDPKATPEQQRDAQEYIDANKGKEGMDGGEKKPNQDDGSDELEKTGDGVEDAQNTDAEQMDTTESDIETLEAAGLEISDDGKSLNDADGNAVEFDVGDKGIVSFDDQPLALIQNDDGTFKEVSPEEAAKLVTPGAEGETSPEGKSDGEVGEIKDLGGKLLKYAYVRDPERFGKGLKKLLGGMGSVLIWAMKAENQKGGDAMDMFTSKVGDMYAKIRDDIKNGKAKANDINKKMAAAKVAMKDLLEKYRDAKSKVIDEMGGKEQFNKGLDDHERRKKFYKNSDSGKMSKDVNTAVDRTSALAARMVFDDLMKTNVSIKNDIKDLLANLKNADSQQTIKSVQAFVTNKNHKIASELDEYLMSKGKMSKEQLAKNIDAQVSKGKKP